MSAILTGILTAALWANLPQAASNLVAEKTGGSIGSLDANGPLESEYRQLLLDDDAAEKEILKWSDEAEKPGNSTGIDSKSALHARIQSRLEGIENEYEKFLRLHPEHVNARLAYGSFLNDTHDEDGAVREWDKARLLATNNPAPWNNLANYYGHHGPVKKAFEYYSKAIELDPKESVYYHNLAVTVYLFRKDAGEYYKINEQQVYDKALELYRDAIRLAPDDFVLFSDYAETFYGTNPPRWKEGLAAWTEALKVAHDEDEREGVYLHLARIHLRLGHFEEARMRLDAVTNSGYAVLKNRLAKNLNQAMLQQQTNAPVKPAEIK